MKQQNAKTCSLAQIRKGAKALKPFATVPITRLVQIIIKRNEKQLTMPLGDRSIHNCNYKRNK